MPNSPVQPLIGKSGRLYIRVVVWSVGQLYVMVATVLMLLWPLKMLSFNFSNFLNWTGLGLTGTIVDLPDAMLDLPDTMVYLLDTMVDLPDTMVNLLDTMVDLLDTMVDLPDTMVDFPDTMVTLPDTCRNVGI